MRPTRDSSRVRDAIRVAIYTRQSVEREANGDFGSIEAQRAAIRAYVDSQRELGWIAIEPSYDDRGVSGGTTVRPALNRLLADVEAGRIDVVATYKFDRLSRSLLDFTQLLRTFDKRGVAFVSVTQSFDTSNATGRLLVNMLASFAEFEREMIRERTRDKVRATRHLGLPCGGRPVLGLDIRNGRYVVNQGEVETVRTIFKAYLDAGSIPRTLATLRKAGIRNKEWQNRKGTSSGGSEFDKISLCRLLRNPLFIGKMRTLDEIVDSHHESIVDEKTFHEVQRRLEERSRTETAKSNPMKAWGALLGGLVFCGKCGGRMGHTTIRRRSRVWRYYACRTRIRRGSAACPSSTVPAQEVEDFIVAKLKAIGRDPDLVARTMELARQKCSERHTAVQDEIRRLDAVRRGLLRDPDDDARTDSLARIDDELDAMRQESSTLTRRTPDDESLATALAAFDPLWNQLDPAERRRIVVLLVARIEVNVSAGTVELQLRDATLQAALDPSQVQSAQESVA